MAFAFTFLFHWTPPQGIIPLVSRCPLNPGKSTDPIYSDIPLDYFLNPEFLKEVSMKKKESQSNKTRSALNKALRQIAWTGVSPVEWAAEIIKINNFYQCWLVAKTYRLLKKENHALSILGPGLAQNESESDFFRLKILEEIMEEYI